VSTNAVLTHLGASTNAVHWTENDTKVYTCTAPACSSKTLVVTAPASVTALALDASYVYYAQAGGAVQKCLAGAACASPTPVTSTSTAAGLAERGGILYGASTGSIGTINNGSIWTVSVNGGTSAPFARENSGPVDVAVDADGVYWVNTTEGTVRSCPLSGCVGPAKVLASGQDKPRKVAVAGGFIYWMTSNAILRIAK
jgi:hypothetical protein